MPQLTSGDFTEKTGYIEKNTSIIDKLQPQHIEIYRVIGSSGGISTGNEKCMTKKMVQSVLIIHCL
jgi:hypothetical protein